MANTILFLKDRVHFSNAAVTVTAKSFTAGTTTPSGTATENGYNPNRVRDTNLKSAWKAPNNSTLDNVLEIDGGATNWLGTGAFYVVISYDARGSDQISLTFKEDTADSNTGTFATSKGVYTLDKTYANHESLFCAVNNSKRYYRIYASNSARGGGSVLPKIYSVSIYTLSDILDLPTTYSTDAVVPADMTSVSQVGVMNGVATKHTNKNGGEYQEFNLNLDRATSALWTAIRDTFWLQDGPNRAFYLQYNGLKNFAQADFSMVRLRDVKRGSFQAFPGLYDTVLPLETERAF
jgi:hypothetical protein